MNDYIFLMHNDAFDQCRDEDWKSYIAKLRSSGQFEGGSVIGTGVCATKSGITTEITAHVSGYILIQAESMSYAQKLLHGDPVFEAGGTVEIRELPRTG